METQAMPFVILAVLAVVILLFLICRELVCWYFKINQRVKLLTEISDYLKPVYVSVETKENEEE